MLNKFQTVIEEVISDYVSFWNFIRFNATYPNTIVKILAVIVVVSLIVPLFIFSSINNLVEYYMRYIFSLIGILLIGVWSSTFWFLIKKRIVFEINIKLRRTLNSYVREVNKNEFVLSEVQNPSEVISEVIHMYKMEQKYHLIRNGLQILLILVLLAYIVESMSVYGFFVFLLMCPFIFAYDGWATDVAFSDVRTLVICISKIHRNNPERCKELIYETDFKGVEYMKEVYKAVKAKSRV